MGTKRRNEQLSMIRQEPQAYVAEYDSNGNVEYEAWANPGAITSDSVWIACKHTYDSNNLLIKTEWAQGTRTDIDGNSVTEAATFINAANNLSGLTYV